MKNNFCFIIPSYCNTDLHGLQLKRCINSIRRFHNNKIIIIDDYSDIDISSFVSSFDNVDIKKSQVKSAGDMVTYLTFKNMTEFETAIIFQDSMTLECALEDIEKIDTMKSVWYFTNHRLHWSHIEEPQTEYNIKNNIKVHDDLILDCIDKLIENEEFKSFAKEIYPQKNKWSGNIGCQSIINHNFLIEMDEKTGIIDFLSKMNNNRLRRVAESIFPIACQYMLGDKVFEKSYDGIYYDGVNIQNGRRNYIAKELGLGNYSDVVEQICKNKYFSKVTFNRRPINIK